MTSMTQIQLGSGVVAQPASPDEVEYFLSEHPMLEPNAQDRMRNLDPTLQKMVINKGSMLDARDQNAVIMSRITQVSRMTEGGGLAIESNKLKPGDWICPSCLDHQFGRNDTCRKCGTPKEMASDNLAEMLGQGIDVPTITERAAPQQVQQFLMQHVVEQHAVDIFLKLDPKLQKIVMNKGSLAEARDQTAMLMGRIKQAQKIASGAITMELKPGDWICPGCHDVQFSRNTTCRQCGSPKPGGGGGGGCGHTAAFAQMGGMGGMGGMRGVQGTQGMQGMQGMGGMGGMQGAQAALWAQMFSGMQ